MQLRKVQSKKRRNAGCGVWAMITAANVQHSTLNIQAPESFHELPIANRRHSRVPLCATRIAGVRGGNGRKGQCFPKVYCGDYRGMNTPHSTTNLQRAFPLLKAADEDHRRLRRQWSPGTKHSRRIKGVNGLNEGREGGES